MAFCQGSRILGLSALARRCVSRALTPESLECRIWTRTPRGRSKPFASADLGFFARHFSTDHGNNHEKGDDHPPTQSQDHGSESGAINLHDSLDQQTNATTSTAPTDALNLRDPSTSSVDIPPPTLASSSENPDAVPVLDGEDNAHVGSVVEEEHAEEEYEDVAEYENEEFEEYDEEEYGEEEFYDEEEGVENDPPFSRTENDDDVDDDDDEEEKEGEEDDEELSALDSKLQGASRKVKRFLMQKMIKVSASEPVSYSTYRKQFQMRVIDVNRTCKVTKGGPINKFTAFVVCGNGEGAVGYGKGKSSEVGAAVDKAYGRAIRNLHFFERFDKRTIKNVQVAKYEKSKVYLWPGKSGSGMRAGKIVGAILRLAGFKDIKTKVIGSRHPHNTVKATFKALSLVASPDVKPKANIPV